MSLKKKIIATLNPLARAVIPQRVYFWMWLRNKPDRQYMESALLPGFASLNPSHVLNVGTQAYCAHYGRYFANGSCEYWTLEIDSALAKFGSPGRHITASVVDVDQHFKQNYFDVVLLNGIFGWGVNDLDDQKKTLTNVRKIMRTGGVLLVGWNDDMLKDEIVQMTEAHGFKHQNPMGLPNRKKFPGGTHTYDLFTAE